MKRLLAILLLLVAIPAFGQDKIVGHLQDISVTIRAESGFGAGQGSGTLVTRKIGDKTVTFVWTAAHVVDNLRKVRPFVDPVTGGTRVAIEFEDAKIVQEFRQNGRRIGELKMDAKIIRYSDAENGEDLALLQVRKTDFVPETTTAIFYLGKDIPPLGTELYHVGSLLGQVGSNSLTTGVISQHGRVLALGANGVVFDQTTATAFPGSSGGGVYHKKDGTYVGMVVRGAGEGFNLIVPVRRMQEWAKRTKVEWALDPSVPVPTQEELDKMPVEDAGANAPSGNMAEKKPCPASIEYPYLLIWKSTVSPDAVEKSALPADKTKSVLDLFHK
jgi:trypsin-like peptidase